MAFLEDVKKGLTDVSETIVKKSGEIVEVQKLKLKKSGLERDIKDAYVQLGKMYFEHMEKCGVVDEEAAEAFHQIVEARDAIAGIKVKLEQVSKEQTCSVCGEKSAKGTAYCPHCGTKFETPAPEDDAEEAASDDAEEAKNVKETKEKVSEAVEEAKEKVSEAMVVVKDKVGAAVEVVKEKIGDAVENMKNKAGSSENEAGTEDAGEAADAEGSEWEADTEAAPAEDGEAAADAEESEWEADTEAAPAEDGEAAADAEETKE